MPVRIRRANLDGDRSALIEILRRYLTPLSDAQRFEWLYCRGPYGRAVSWVACDPSTNEIIGAAAAFPRKVYSNGEEKLGAVLGDFCMTEKYRSLGPSLQLQRACLAVVEEHPFEFLYDFPSESMMAVYKRLGLQRTGTLVRWAKPLQVEKKVESILHSETLAGGVGFFLNAALARRGWKGDKYTCEIELHQGLCGEEFDKLGAQLRPRAGVQTARSAAYLNWRYLQHPHTAHEILKATRNGVLLGYIVYTKDPDDASVVDLDCIEAAVVARLLAAAVDRLRSVGATTVSLNAANTHPWSSVFERAGFRTRERAPIIIYFRSSARSIADNLQAKWYAMRGERDS